MKYILVLLLLCCGAASASEQIAFYEAAPNESLDDFIVRIAPDAVKRGNDLTAEVCGSVEQNENGYSMILGTSNSQLFCNIPSLWLTSPIGVSFHTHPKRQRDGTMMLTRSTRSQMATERVIVKLGYGFSDGDYTDGKGYLAEGTKVFYQEGRGTSRQLGN